MTQTRASPNVLKRLRFGNGQYLARRGSPTHVSVGSADSAIPIAAAVVCSDLYLQVEDVFDLAPGQLYVMQTAGCVTGLGERSGLAYLTQQGPIELVVILGHRRCKLLKDPPTQLGQISAEMMNSVHAAETVGADVHEVHALRMAQRFREQLGPGTGLELVAAVLDEGSGEVRFLDQA